MVRFPAVTVCNQNPIKKDRLEKDILEEINLKLQQLLAEDQDDKKGKPIIHFISGCLRSREETYCSCLHQDVSSSNTTEEARFTFFAGGLGGWGGGSYLQGKTKTKNKTLLCLPICAAQCSGMRYVLSWSRR